MSSRFRRCSAVLACLSSAAFLLISASHGFAWDYSINWTAALALRNGEPLYDGAALRQIAEQRIGPPMNRLFDQPFTSYIGPPTTAILLLPFTLWSFPTSLIVYRAIAALIFSGGVVITGFAVPARARAIAWATGGLCLIGWHAVVFSVELGQVDAWIVLFLATSVLAIRHKRWNIAGIGIGLATLLKVSPGLLLLYCLLKRQWSAARWALVTLSAGLLISLLPRRGADLHAFVFQVIPSLSAGSIHVENQALGAWLARLLAPDPQFLVLAMPVGVWRYVGLGVAGGLTVLFYWLRRHAELEPIDIGIVILIALLAGPITWDHYTSWALISAMTLMPALQGPKRALLAVCLIVLAFPVANIPRERIVDAPWLRVVTGAQMIALLGMLLIGLADGALKQRLVIAHRSHQDMPQ